jgi:uncharacterized membrane protein YgcG
MIGLRCAVIVLVPLALSACMVPDASKADGAWAPKGLNAANLAAMVEKPADLSHGRGDPGPERKLAAHAVIDLWTNPTGASSSPAGGSAGGGSGGGSGSGGGGGSASPGSGN